MWHQHGGSGLGLSFEDCQNLDYAEIPDLYERLGERRRMEANAIAAANKPRGRRAR